MSPATRAPLLLLAFISLVCATAGGLVRIGVLEGLAPASAIAWHGALMVSGFFGTLISLERAVAIGRPWAYAAPLACGAGGVLLAAGEPFAGLWLMAAGALALAAASAALLARQATLEGWTLLAGAVAWLAGNVLAARGAPLAAAVPWWIVFFVLTICAERLELSRYVPRGRGAKLTFAVLAAATLLAALAGRVLGVTLVLFALWLFKYDIARATVRQSGLPRYIAVCLLSGYAWLALGGALLAAEGAAASPSIHAILVGFVLSMVFGHAPVILPAILRVAIPYSAALYAPLALLHASLALRLAAELGGADAAAAAGAAGNALAIAAFIATAAGTAFIGAHQGRKGAPGRRSARSTQEEIP